MSKPRPGLWKKSPECWMLSTTPPPPVWQANLNNPIWFGPVGDETWTMDPYPASAIYSITLPVATGGDVMFGESSSSCAESVGNSAVFLAAPYLRQFTTPNAGRAQARFVWHSLSTANQGVITVVGPTGLVITLGITPFGHLRLFTGASGPGHWLDSNLSGDGPTGLVTGRQYRICLQWNITSDSDWFATWWINDDTANPATIQTPEGTAGGDSLSTNSPTNIIGFGITTNVTFAGTANVSVGHIVIDTEPTAKDMGDVRATTKLAQTEVFTGFTTPVGAAAGAHHLTYAARPNTTANGWRQPAPASSFDACVAQDSATGDVDITGMTILAGMTFILASGGTLQTNFELEYDNSQETITIGTGIEVSFQTWPTTDWDADTRLCGLGSSPYAASTTLYTAGCTVAYTP